MKALTNKGGRPLRKEDVSVTLNVRLSPQERLSIEFEAGLAGLKLSEFIRRCSLGRKVGSVLDREIFLKLIDIEKEILRQGGTFALAAHQLALTPADMKLRLELHEQILGELRVLIMNLSDQFATTKRRGKLGSNK